MIAAVGEGILASLGGISAVRFVIRRVFWIHENRKLVMELKASRRGYNINYVAAQDKAPDPAPYTIPTDLERPHP